MFKFFENLIEPFPEAEPTQPPTGVIAFCWYYTKTAWPYLLVITALVTIIAVLDVMLYGFLGNAVDWLATADRETFLVQERDTLMWMGFVVLVALPLATIAHTFLLHQTIFGNYPMIIRWLSHRYLLRQSYSFYQDEFAGRIVTKVMQASQGVREVVLKVLDVLVYAVVYFAGGMVLVASFDLWMMVPFIVWIIAYVSILRYFLPRLARQSKATADTRAIMTGRLVDGYANMLTVKLFSHAGRETKFARQAMETFLGKVRKLMRNITMLRIALSTSNTILFFAVGWISIASWLDGTTTPGAVAVAIGFVLRLQGMSQWIMWEMSGLFENIGMVQDSMATIARPVSVIDKPGANKLMVKKGLIEFDRIRFHYGKESGVIDDLSLTIQPGEKVGIVGRSGSGKTTLMNILLRLYDLEGGAVRIDGQDISGVTQESLRAQIGVVTQDTSLLHRSVADNIAYAKGSASKAEIASAAKRSRADEFIDELEDNKDRTGYEAFVGERGVKLSGGQRQRLAIARVFLKDAPILVLDEATSALDSEVEAAIQENLNELMQDKTVIAIAHRLSTISALDRLVVLDEGEIVEQGNHEELIKKGGIYAQLWARQSGGFIG